MNQPVTQAYYQSAKKTFNAYFPNNLTSMLWTDIKLFKDLVKSNSEKGFTHVYFHCMNFIYDTSMPDALKEFDKNLYVFIRFSKDSGSEIKSEDKCYFIHNINSEISLSNAGLNNTFSDYKAGIGKTVLDAFIKNEDSHYLTACFEYSISKVLSYINYLDTFNNVAKIKFEICVGDQKNSKGTTYSTLFFVNIGTDNALKNITNMDFYNYTQLHP